MRRKKRLKKKLYDILKRPSPSIQLVVSLNLSCIRYVYHSFKLYELYNRVKLTCYEKEFAYIYNAQDTFVFLKGKLVSAFCVHPYQVYTRWNICEREV